MHILHWYASWWQHNFGAALLWHLAGIIGISATIQGFHEDRQMYHKRTRDSYKD